MVLLKYPNFKKVGEKVPVRLTVAAMLFMACWMSYMLRVNMSINIIAMTERRTGEDGQHKPECLAKDKTMQGNGTDNRHRENETIVEPLKDYGDRYHWSTNEQGMILGCYFWGYILTSMPGGLLSDYFGGTRVIGITTIVSAILTALCPVAAGYHYGALIAIRFMLGFLAGVVYPALHSLVSKWSPPDEKGKFIAALLGGTFGTVVTWSFTGYLIETYGWVWAFYIPAIIALIWSVLWFILVSDTPQQNHWISKTESEYIVESLGNNVSKKKKITPFLKLSTSVPFWALALLHFGNLWGLYFLLTSAPKFLTEVLGFDIKNAGFLSGLPYLARMIMGFIFGAVGDLVRRKEWLSVTNIRKSFCFFSHLIPGLFLFGMAFVGCDPLLSVAIITLSLGFNGASTMTNLQNSQDLAPNFAGTLYGLINCLGSTTGFITPQLTGYFTREKSGLTEWHNIFKVGAAVYIIPAIVFWFLGSGSVQSWNDIPIEDKDVDKEAQAGIPEETQQTPTPNTQTIITST